MRVAIISDIHGNLAALDAVIADLKRQSPDLVVHLGDLAVTGPRGFAPDVPPASIVASLPQKCSRG